MTEESRLLNSRLVRMEETLDKVFGLLNGPEGLVTKCELHGQRLADMPSPHQLKWYSAVGGGAVMFLGVVAYAIIKMMG